MIKTKLKFASFLILTFLFTNVKAQDKYKIATVAFYNVENLFDIYNSADHIDGRLDIEDKNYHKSISVNHDSLYPYLEGSRKFTERYTFDNLKGKVAVRDTRDTEYTKEGRNNWTKDKYDHKLEQLSKVISDIGFKKAQTTPAIVGLSEVENRKVVEDLVNTSKLKSSNYGIVHYNSFDARGIDVALIYKKDLFKVEYSKRYVLKIYDKKKNNRRIYTRDQLLVKGQLDGEDLYVIVNHWPSRYGGEKRSRPNRIAAAKLNMEIIQEIRAKDPMAKIVTMGDLNDDPTSASVKKIMKPKSKKNQVKTNDLYNPMYDLRRRGVGSLAYRDSWNLFDQIIVSGPLVGKDYKDFKLLNTAVYRRKFLQQAMGPYKGYPLRTFAGGQYTKGYSDHFPVYIQLVKKVK